MEKDNIFEENIPTKQKEIILKLLNQKISKIIRYSWDTPAYMVDEWDIPEPYVFNLTDGPLLITLETGLVIGFASQPSLASVTVWIEETENGKSEKDEKTADDDELYPIDVRDSVYSPKEFHSIIGQEIVDIKLLKRIPENALFEGLPGEVGLLIKFKNNTEMVLSHGLHDNSDGFSVLLKSQILPEILLQLTEVDMFK